jgi:hypothetical protein
MTLSFHEIDPIPSKMLQALQNDSIIHGFSVETPSKSRACYALVSTAKGTSSLAVRINMWPAHFQNVRSPPFGCRL